MQRNQRIHPTALAELHSISQLRTYPLRFLPYVHNALVTGRRKMRHVLVFREGSSVDDEDDATTVQKLDVPGPDEKFCLCWLCAFTKFSSGGAIFPVHLIFEHL